MSIRKKIPMFYPYVSNKAVEETLKVLRDRWIGQGPKVNEFEDAFKSVIGCRYAVAVSGVSPAIRLALAITGVGPGDEVITTPQTCTATNHPILEQYAVPVFSDIKYETGNIDPDDIEKRITDKTKALICVHVGGYPCDMDKIQDIAKRYRLSVIEDAQDALGASYKGRSIGTISRFTCFSFGPVQQVTCGEGGMLATLEREDYRTSFKRRWFSIDREERIPNNVGYYDFDVKEAGYSYHMTSTQAVMGLIHLSELGRILKRRSEISELYSNELKVVPGVTLFENKEDKKSAYQIFGMHVERRDDFCRMMCQKGIEVSIVHQRNDAYSVFGGFRDDLPVLDRFSKTYINIPLNNSLSDEEVDKIIKEIKNGW